MRQLIASALVAIVLMASIPVGAADAGGSATYVGGTLDLPEKSKGKLLVDDATMARFTCKRGTVEIPYATIESIEYGQKAGRRVGAAVVVSPLLLFSKKRKHFVTLAYRDAAGVPQGAVFEVSKGAAYVVAKTLESRSGKSIDYESDEARTHLEKAGR